MCRVKVIVLTMMVENINQTSEKVRTLLMKSYDQVGGEWTFTTTNKDRNENNCNYDTRAVLSFSVNLFCMFIYYNDLSRTVTSIDTVVRRVQTSKKKSD